MSEAEQADADDPEPADGVEDAEPDADEQPALDEDEMADWGDVADAVEDEVEDGADEDEGGDESTSTSDETADEAPDQGDAAEGSVTLGTVYCNCLGLGAATVREGYGDPDGMDREEMIEEYSGLAEQMQIDEYVDEWMRVRGGMDELPPHVAALLMTVAFAGMVAVDDPDLATNALDQMEVADGF